MKNAYLIDFLITSSRYLGLGKKAVQNQIQNRLFKFYTEHVQLKPAELNRSDIE